MHAVLTELSRGRLVATRTSMWIFAIVVESLSLAFTGSGNPPRAREGTGIFTVASTVYAIFVAKPRNSAQRGAN